MNTDRYTQRIADALTALVARTPDAILPDDDTALVTLAQSIAQRAHRAAERRGVDPRDLADALERTP